MNNIRYTIIYFDYGGYYSKNGEEVKWIAREFQCYPLLFKTSIENITYTGLVDRICKKLRVDESTTKLKLSYIPIVVDPKKPCYILDDEDVLGYLMEVDKDQCRTLLHVEFFNDAEQNQCCEQLSRNDRGSEIEGKNEEMISSNHDRVKDGINTLHKGENNELLDNIDITNGENVSCEEFGNVGNSEGVNGTPSGEGDQYVNEAWDDGIDLSVGQTFGSKKAVQELVYKGSHQNCFDIAIIKSDLKLLVIKCRGAKDGCKWYLRVAKLRNSDCFSVRTYNKVHTCSPVTTSTSIDKRLGTPQLVANILLEEYAGQIHTPTPKDLVRIVEERIGVKISYSTALRGKKQAVKEVCGSP